MSTIDTYVLSHSNILTLYSEKDEIWVDPPYQRNGGIWTLEKKQLLLDSIINRYDIPKIYFHKLSKPEQEKRGKKYAIIDGKQRMEAIWQFIDGAFALDDTFSYLKDPKIDLSGLTYNELAEKHRTIKGLFDAFTLPIIVVDTDDIDLIEELFSRLNEAVPLNAAEKRNAIGGDAAAAINKLALHDFFKKKVKFSNKRYQYKEQASRLLYLQWCIENPSRIMDTKKPFLDKFVREHKKGQANIVNNLRKNVVEILDLMTGIFVDKDDLLRAQSSIVVYYLALWYVSDQGKASTMKRKSIIDFRSALEENRRIAATDLTQADYELLEFDRMSQQGTNDAVSIKYRVSVLLKHLGFKIKSDELLYHSKIT